MQWQKNKKRNKKGEEKMIITSEIASMYDFEFWSGAKDTIEELSESEVNTILGILEDCYPDGMTDTQLNDFFWFERDTIAEWLGYKDFDCIMRKNRYGDTVKVKITDIKWDVDEDENGDDLPTEIIAEFDYTGDNDELCYTIADWLTDEYKHCHEGFNYKIMEEGL